MQLLQAKLVGFAFLPQAFALLLPDFLLLDQPGNAIVVVFRRCHEPGCFCLRRAGPLLQRPGSGLGVGALLHQPVEVRAMITCLLGGQSDGLFALSPGDAGGLQFGAQGSLAFLGPGAIALQYCCFGEKSIQLFACAIAGLARLAKLLVGDNRFLLRFHFAADQTL